MYNEINPINILSKEHRRNGRKRYTSITESNFYTIISAHAHWTQTLVNVYTEYCSRSNKRDSPAISSIYCMLIIMMMMMKIMSLKMRKKEMKVKIHWMKEGFRHSREQFIVLSMTMNCPSRCFISVSLFSRSTFSRMKNGDI